jgi:hypothetical protein
VSLELGDILAGVALVLSLVATVTTIRFNVRQNSLIESQRRLNERLLIRDWRLKVYNRGKAAARNVKIVMPADDDLLIPSDVNSKFPLEILEPAHGVDMIASVHFGSKSKHEVTLSWSDDFSDTNEKTTYVTI